MKWISVVFALGLFCMALFLSLDKTHTNYSKGRAFMVKHDIIGRGIKNKDVIKAMETVPREEFVSKGLMTEAYGDHPLPIGYGQTISQPYIVAYMTEILLEGGPLKRVLEVGTGSGYQAAILSHVASEVYTIEIIEPLYEQSTQVLQNLNYINVHTKYGDGYLGWEDHAPYNGIVVTAATPDIPPPLIKQLKNGGRMIIPVGSPLGIQYLVLVQKDDQGNITTKNLLPVRFVPLTRIQR